MSCEESTFVQEKLSQVNKEECIVILLVHILKMEPRRQLDS